MTSERSGDSLLEDRFWEAAARVTVVGGIALPILGYAIRYFSLGVAGLPTHISLAVSPPRAATVALEPFLLALALLALIVRLDVLGLRTSSPRPRGPRASVRGWRRVGVIVASAFLVGAVLIVLAAFVIAVASYLLSQPISAVPLLAGLLVSRRLLGAVVRHEVPVTIASVAPATLVLLVGIATGTAIGPASVLDVSDYSFRATAGLTSGWYQTLGEADGWVYLRPCSPPAGVVKVQQADIAMVRLFQGRVRAATSTVSEIVFEGLRPVADACDSETR